MPYVLVLLPEITKVLTKLRHDLAQISRLNFGEPDMLRPEFSFFFCFRFESLFCLLPCQFVLLAPLDQLLHRIAEMGNGGILRK